MSETTEQGNDETFQKKGMSLITLWQNRNNNFSKIDLIFSDPTTGSILYTGSIEAARDKELLNKRGISGVINTAREIKNFHHADRTFSYFRFEITKKSLQIAQKVVDADLALHMVHFVDTLIDQIETWFNELRNVLIHCHAGAHRAGTSTVLFLMGKLGLWSKEAIVLAQKKRTVIDPIMNLGVFLQKFDEGLKLLNERGEFEEGTRWYRKIDDEQSSH
eukprot:maker-scaffold_25-snap-gene-2.3-mRNA-1 protein AED:0.01 eAED:0.01 QI:137/1/1/1/1/1/3/1170/218